MIDPALISGFNTVFSGGAFLASAAAICISLFRGAALHGADRQRLLDVENGVSAAALQRASDLREASERYASAQDTAELKRRQAEMDADLREALKALSEVKVISAQLTSLDRLVTRELDEIKHSLRNMRMVSQDRADRAGTPRA